MRYVFLPYFQQGLSRQIQSGRFENQRASLNAKLFVTKDGKEQGQIEKSLSLYGPQDVLGINHSMITKVFPQPDDAQALTNYFAYIEFYDEGFPWRYTPERPVDNRLRPWLALVVLTEEEFSLYPQATPLPKALMQVSENTFQPISEIAFWAHAQVNCPLKDYRNSNVLKEFVKANPDQVFSRIICPRILEPNKRYHAFLIPTYETGRLAGLGQGIPKEILPTQLAWEQADPTKDPTKKEFPIYHQWSFITSNTGDFEYYLSRLKPLEWNATTNQIGQLDVKIDWDKKWGLECLNTENTKNPIKFNTVYFARSVEKSDKLTHADGVKPFESSTNDLDDPVIGLPLYGSKYIDQPIQGPKDKNDKVPNHWASELNFYISNRIAAGIGAQHIQKHQEEYMQRAWEAAGKVYEYYEMKRLAEGAEAVMWATVNKFIWATVNKPKWANVKKSKWDGSIKLFLLYAYPIINKFDDEMKQKLNFGALFPDKDISLISGSVRKVYRQGSSWVRNSNDLNNSSGENTIRVNTFRELMSSNKLPSSTIDNFYDIDVFLDANLNIHKLKFTDLGMIPGIGRNLRNYALMPESDESYNQNNIKNPNFVRRLYRTKLFDPSIPNEIENIEIFKEEVIDLGADDKLKKIAALTILLDPRKVIYDRIDSMYNVPDKIPEEPIDFPDPMAKVLEKENKDLFCANLHLIPQDSVCLLDVNEQFIEAFMLGLNDAINREMLWREYPTDQKLTPFRQFWDPGDNVKNDGSPENVEALKDIAPYRNFVKNNLGDNYLSKHKAGETTALAIRSDLLKKFPNMMIYVQKLKGEKELDSGTIIYPLFSTRVEPDITFVHFPLSADKIVEQNYYFIFAERIGEINFGLDLQKPNKSAFQKKSARENIPNVNNSKDTIPNWDEFSQFHVSADTIEPYRITPPFLRIDYNSSIDSESITSMGWYGSQPDSVIVNQSERDSIKWGQRYLSAPPGIDPAKVAYMTFQKPVMRAIQGKLLLPSTAPQKQ